LLIFIHIPYDPGLNPRLHANAEKLQIMTALLPAVAAFQAAKQRHSFSFMLHVAQKRVGSEDCDRWSSKRID
jgi:hypothetical protein